MHQPNILEFIILLKILYYKFNQRRQIHGYRPPLYADDAALRARRRQRRVSPHTCTRATTTTITITATSHRVPHAPAKCDSCAHTRRTLILYRNVTIWCREWCRCKVYMVLLCIGVRELECAGHDRARTMRIARACPYGRIRIDNQHARARSRARRYDRKCACVCVCRMVVVCSRCRARVCIHMKRATVPRASDWIPAIRLPRNW